MINRQLTAENWQIQKEKKNITIDVCGHEEFGNGHACYLPLVLSVLRKGTGRERERVLAAPIACF